MSQYEGLTNDQRLSVYVSQKLKEDLERVASSVRRPVSEFIRLLLEEGVGEWGGEG